MLFRRGLKMRNTSGCLSSNIEEKELKDKPNNFNIPVSRQEKERLCLKCGKNFLSNGPHNRICVKCGLINERSKSRHIPNFTSGKVFRKSSNLIENLSI